MAVIAAALFVPSVANADITGTVTTPRGAPVAGVSVELRDANNNFVDYQSTDGAGKWTTKTADIGSGHPTPFTAKVSTYDNCDTSGNSSREASVSIPGDGQVADMQIDLLEFCNGASYSGPEGTAYIDAPGHQIISAPGGTGTLQVLSKGSATNFVISLPDGTQLGTGTDPSAIPVTFPSAPYNGPFLVNYTSNGQQFSFTAGTLTVASAGPPAPASGNVDLEAIVDLSGSMSGTDPKFRRKDAVNLLLDLAKTGDKLGAVGFDDQYRPIFDLTTISGQSVINTLKGKVNTNVINGGGTNYNVGFDQAYKALTAPGVDPKRPKGAIFLTDGGHNSGPYNNGHLRFAINPSGHSWPVCVVQLGTSFQPTDVDRLKRIATETGGQYVATPTDDQLVGLYFSCLGLTTGAKTVVNKTFVFKQGQTKTAAQRLPKKKLPSVTFFVNWGQGKYLVTLKDPKGHIHTRSKPGRGATFGQGASYAFFRIRRPDGGVWRMNVKALQLPAKTDKANVKITITPKTS